MEHLLLEDLIGERRFDVADTIPREICFSRLCRPRHHVDMGMLALIVEGSVPAEVIRLNVHGGGDVIAICSEQVPPRFGVVIAKTRSVLTLQ